MAAQVRRDQSVTGWRFRKDVMPVGAASHGAMEPQQGFPVSDRFPIQVDPVHVEDHRASFKRVSFRRRSWCASCGAVGGTLVAIDLMAARTRIGEIVGGVGYLLLVFCPRGGKNREACRAHVPRELLKIGLLQRNRFAVLTRSTWREN